MPFSGENDASSFSLPISLLNVVFLKSTRHGSSSPQRDSCFHARTTTTTSLSLALTVSMGSYSVEPAKSGRSTCRGKCKGAIAEGELRWGSHPETTEHDMCYWSHLDCVSLKTIQTAIEVHGTLAEIPGVVEHDAVGLLTAAVATAQRVRAWFPFPAFQKQRLFVPLRPVR